MSRQIAKNDEEIAKRDQELAQLKAKVSQLESEAAEMKETLSMDPWKDFDHLKREKMQLQGELLQCIEKDMNSDNEAARMIAQQRWKQLANADNAMNAFKA